MWVFQHRYDCITPLARPLEAHGHRLDAANQLAIGQFLARFALDGDGFGVAPKASMEKIYG